MRIHYILHAPFEGLGIIEDWIKQHNYHLSGTHTYRGEQLPKLSAFDFLIIMGGPQSACKLDDYPYLRDEIQLTKQAISAGKAVLGICLGAQIIGEALGAKTEHSPEKEIGVYPVQTLPEAQFDPLFKQFPQEFAVMHWHSDMPGLPQGSVLLAKSAGCPKQAFRYGDRVYGFQFHLEITPALMQNMVHHCQDELTPDRYVQSADELLKSDLTTINHKMLVTLNYLAEKILLTENVE